MEAVVTAREMSETLERLAVELHQMLSRMHASRPRFEDPAMRAQFSARVQELADRTQAAREMANAMWSSFGDSVANARDSVQARREAWGDRYAQARDAAQAGEKRWANGWQTLEIPPRPVARLLLTPWTPWPTSCVHLPPIARLGPE